MLRQQRADGDRRTELSERLIGQALEAARLVQPGENDFHLSLGVLHQFTQRDDIGEFTVPGVLGEKAINLVE